MNNANTSLFELVVQRPSKPGVSSHSLKRNNNLKQKPAAFQFNDSQSELNYPGSKSQVDKSGTNNISYINKFSTIQQSYNFKTPLISSSNSFRMNQMTSEQEEQLFKFLEKDQQKGQTHQYGEQEKYTASKTMKTAMFRPDSKSSGRTSVPNNIIRVQKTINFQIKQSFISPNQSQNQTLNFKNSRKKMALKTAGYNNARRGIRQPIKCLDLIQDKGYSQKQDVKKVKANFQNENDIPEDIPNSGQSLNQNIYNSFALEQKILLPIQSAKIKRPDPPQLEKTKEELYFSDDTYQSTPINRIKRGYSLKSSNTEYKILQNNNQFPVEQNTLQSLTVCPSLHSIDKITQVQQRKEVTMTDEEKKLYGDRFIEGYKKINLLGKGGFALVWLASSEQQPQKTYAIKQIARQNGSDSYLREMRVYQQFFEENGEAKQEYEAFEGINELLKCIEVKQYQKDVFMVYELGGISLSQQLYSMKGEFFKGERLYKINFTELYEQIFETKSNNFLKSLVQKLLEQLKLLSQAKIVHCDIKPENILVELDATYFNKVSLIDFGSSFCLEDKGQVGMATPEYLPPEMLETFKISSAMNGKISQIEKLNKTVHPHSIDTWCVGATLLEVLTGVPHWLSYKCRVIDNITNKSLIKQGLFFTKAQDYEKIILKQQQFCDNYNSFFKEITKKFDCSETGKKFQDLIQKMMKFNPQERISPEEALSHPFLD